ncbi:MAG: hypothetical protein ACRENG_10085 [bacterium]
MSKFRKTLSLLLTLSLLQFFVPVLNVAMELPCCEEQAISSRSMPCCGAEYPSRTVCCTSKAAPAENDAAPTQATLEKSSLAQLEFASYDQSFEIDLSVAPKISADEDFSFLNPRLTSNQRYKLLATFLI